MIIIKRRINKVENEMIAKLVICLFSLVKQFTVGTDVWKLELKRKFYRILNNFNFEIYYKELTIKNNSEPGNS